MAIAVLNGESIEDGADNVRNRLKPIMFTAWKFWPLVHCVTYGLIPSRHRILWVNSVDLVWNAILASKARGDDDDEKDHGDGRDDKPGEAESDDNHDRGASEVKENGAGFDVFRSVGILLSSLDSSRDEVGVPSEVSVVESSVIAPDSSDAKTLMVEEETRR
jgi:hypothetical protein